MSMAVEVKVIDNHGGIHFSEIMLIMKKKKNGCKALARLKVTNPDYFFCWNYFCEEKNEHGYQGTGCKCLKA